MDACRTTVKDTSLWIQPLSFKKRKGLYEIPKENGGIFNPAKEILKKRELGTSVRTAAFLSY